MKHIRFSEAEPILGIRRVRNSVFTEDEHTLCVLSPNWARLISTLLDSEGIPNHRIRKGGDTYTKIFLERKNLCFPQFYFKNTSDDEILVMMGQDKIWVKDSLGRTILVGDEATGKWKPNNTSI